MKEEKIKNFKTAFLNKINKHKILTLIFGWIIILYSADFAINFYNSIFVGDCAYYGKYEDVKDLFESDKKNLEYDEITINALEKLNRINPVTHAHLPSRRFLGKTNDKRLIFYTVQETSRLKHEVVAELYNPANNFITRLPLGRKVIVDFGAVWLGDDKFVVIYDNNSKMLICTYKINEDNTIKEITQRIEKNHGYGYSRIQKLYCKSALALNSETVIFKGPGISPFKLVNAFYLYNYKTNKLIRLEDCPCKGDHTVFHRLNDYSFLLYGWDVKYKEDKNVYIYKINKKAAKVD